MNFLGFWVAFGKGKVEKGTGTCFEDSDLIFGIGIGNSADFADGSATIFSEETVLFTRGERNGVASFLY